MTSTTLQIRLDTKVKKDAQSAAKKLGIDISSVIKLLLGEFVRTGTLNASLRDENGYTPEFQAELRAAIAEPLGKSYTSVKEMFADILKD